MKLCHYPLIEIDILFEVWKFKVKTGFCFATRTTCCVVEKLSGQTGGSWSDYMSLCMENLHMQVNTIFHVWLACGRNLISVIVYISNGFAQHQRELVRYTRRLRGRDHHDGDSCTIDPCYIWQRGSITIVDVYSIELQSWLDMIMAFQHIENVIICEMYHFQG